MVSHGVTLGVTKGGEKGGETQINRVLAPCHNRTLVRFSAERYQRLCSAAPFNLFSLTKQVSALRDIIKKQDESIHVLEEENKKLQKSNHELRESTRDSGVDLLSTGTAADLNRQMLELSSVIRNQVDRQFCRRSTISNGSANEALEEVDGGVPEEVFGDQS